MANWAITDYVIVGPHETLSKINDAIVHPDVEENTDEHWEGNVLKTLGIDWENIKPDGIGLYMRGFIQEEPSFGENTLEFYAEEAWGATDFNVALEKTFPDIKVYFRVEEEGGEVYATNDKEGRFFPSRYYVDTCINGNYGSEYFVKEETMWKWLSEHTNGRVTDEKSAEEFNADYEDTCADAENFISIHRFEICD